MRKLIFSLFLLVVSTAIAATEQYNLVLEGGRVMDPETGMNAVRNVGIRDGKIVRISSEAPERAAPCSCRRTRGRAWVY